ncbi:MAG: endonuclease/exonuclease/phosphatase family protein [Bacteroidales bacterium]|nr:endonuclease/exonuclease/phosphatase family protein [Bacteroidales bacterium]
MKKFIHQVIIILNFVAIVPLLLAYLSIYISPAKIWIVSLLGLGYPYLLLLNLFFVIFWIYRKRWAFLYSLAAILLGWTFLGRTVQLNIRNSQHIASEPFSLLSYNVRHFDKFNWTHDEETPSKIADFIVDEQADIICMQEIARLGYRHLSQHPQLKLITNNQNYHVDFCTPNAGLYAAGMITISRFPIVGKGVIRFEASSNMGIYTDLKINTDTVRVFNLHLQSFNLDPREYSLLDSLDIRNRGKNLKEAENILGHLKNGFINRAAQAEKVAQTIDESPYPVIICGDFNDSPVSYTYQTIFGDLKDAFVESGTGISNTYRGKFPSFRIDYILHSEKLIASKYHKHKVKLSDHYPISATFALNP